VQMFRSKKVKVEYITPEFYKDWGNAAYELKCLEHRLDAVRSALKECKPDSWAYRHWAETEAVLLRKWKHTVRLKDVGLRQINKVDMGPAIDYDWWEGSEEVAMRFPILDGISNWIQDRVVGSASLDRAWAKAQEEKLQKARQGLA